VRELLKHPNVMRDKVHCQANAIKHKIQYSNLVESGLQTIMRKTVVGMMPLPKSYLWLA
jgi:hypothetical protein